MSRNARRREMRRLQRFERNHAHNMDRALDAADYWRGKAKRLEHEVNAQAEKLKQLIAAREAECAFLREPSAEAYEVPLIGEYQTVRVRL